MLPPLLLVYKTLSLPCLPLPTSNPLPPFLPYFCYLVTVNLCQEIPVSDLTYHSQDPPTLLSFSIVLAVWVFASLCVNFRVTFSVSTK